MRVLVACEFSGIVREAFRTRGHDAVSCDLLPTEIPGPHIRGDVTKVFCEQWDVMLAFPPCTHLAASGARWFHLKQREQAEALKFVEILLCATWIPKICLENPVGIISTHLWKPTQIIQPWQFGHPETKKTCLWLKNLPSLKPTTNVVDGRYPRVHREPPSPNRWKNRSRMYQGIADAMAEQWG